VITTAGNISEYISASPKVVTYSSSHLSNPNTCHPNPQRFA